MVYTRYSSVHMPVNIQPRQKSRNLTLNHIQTSKLGFQVLGKIAICVYMALHYPPVICYIAIETEIVSFPIGHGDIPYLCKCLPEGKPPCSHVFSVVFPWFSYGFPMVFLWFFSMVICAKLH